MDATPRLPGGRKGQPFRLLRAAGIGLLDLLFPLRCSGCGRHGAAFCPACQARLEPPPARTCHRCGAAAALDLCDGCRGAPSPLDGIVAAALFQPPIQPAVHDLKYNGVRDLACPLGEIMAAGWPRTGLAADVIAPVPLHRARRAERGYNQSGLLAQVLGERIGVPVDENLVIRQRATRPQVGLGQVERRENVAGAFVCRQPAAGLRVVLVDDVCTTGATLEACAAALKAAGAVAVWGYTLTRARWQDGLA